MNQPHRICIICATFPPDICGIGDYTAQLARALSAQGEQITILTEQRGPDTSIEIAEPLITVKRIFSGWNWQILSQLQREIQREKYDLVHIQYTPQFYGRQTWIMSLLPLWFKVRTGRRTMVTFHEIYTPVLPGLKALLTGIYLRLNDTILLWSSYASIVTVDNRRKRLSRQFPWLKNRIHTIPVGSGLPIAQETGDGREATRKQLGITPEDLVIGSFGALHTDKRYDILFRAVRQLLDKGHSVRLLMIGAVSEDHPYWKELQKCIAELDLTPYIVWTGFGEPADVSRWFSALDLYVMTDLRGVSGRKSSLITALAHGLPIVATRGTDTSDDFVDGENIVLIDLEDENMLVQKIHHLLKTPEDRHLLREGAHRLYRERYGWEKIAERTREVYLNL